MDTQKGLKNVNKFIYQEVRDPNQNASSFHVHQYSGASCVFSFSSF